jgi:hypothetical protein
VSVQVDVAAVPGSHSDANGVLEPGETVVAAPSWRALRPTFNLSGLAIHFSGPLGGSYDIGDPAASYGTMDTDETRSCLDTNDCYLLKLDLASGSARPQLHWDATLTERVRGGIGLGESHGWSIHVGDSFSDVPRNTPYYLSVETLLHKGVIGGCGNGNLCAKDKLSRAQMAVLALASYGISPTPCDATQPRMFLDVDTSSPYCRWIEELARRGLAHDDLGPSAAFYHPSVDARRKYIAYAVVSLPGGPPPPPCIPEMPLRFDDVNPSDPYCPWVEELSRALDGMDPRILLSVRSGDGVGGCTSPRFCPEDPPFREEAATYEVAYFGLTLDH